MRRGRESEKKCGSQMKAAGAVSFLRFRVRVSQCQLKIIKNVIVREGCAMWEF
jgi:hypothetical protein